MRQIDVQASRCYRVSIGSGMLHSVGKTVHELTKADKLCIVTDRNVWSLYGEPLAHELAKAGFYICTFVLHPGEESKNWRTYLGILECLAQHGLSRDDCILALGGGVVGDLAGFAAATYLRGIPYIQLPTSLLAMVDSSVGGKTAIDLDAGKNLVGAFYQPIAVLCDTDTLRTLPEDIFLDGCTEVIKYGVLYDAALFAQLETDGPDFDREAIIARCVELKRDAVTADEFDKGQRKMLNLGHTIGHAIETCSNYTISHGKAVAMGMALVCRAAKCADTERIEILLRKFGLPCRTDYSAAQLYDLALSDKKRSGASIDLIIPKAVGDCAIVPTPVEKLKTFIEEGMQVDITILPQTLQGCVTAPPSKSMAHRLLICAAFAKTSSDLICPQINDDITATAECLNLICHAIMRTDYGYDICPYQCETDSGPSAVYLNCHESGSTLRFMLPIVGALGMDTLFELEGRLPQRPLSPLWEEMERMGCQLSRPAENLIRCKGKLRPGHYRIDGSVSSQFVSGLMFALPLIDGETSLEITGQIESKPYIEMTRQVIERFKNGCPERIEVEGDWSSAAFWLAANALGSRIIVDGLDTASVQGDRVITELLSALQKNCSICAADIPDLVPVLAVVAAANKGAVFTDIRRLRLKESDRVAAIMDMLQALGGKAEATENTLTVYGGRLNGGTVDSHKDHRIAMAAAIAATVCKEPVTILNAECVKKSYPEFWKDYACLGGNYVENLR